MKRRNVEDVMTTPAISVGETATYREIIDTMMSRGISAVPVVDADDRVVGVVSEADLLHKMEFAGVGPARRLIERRREREGRIKADATAASELMSEPPITIRPNATVGAAAALMSEYAVKRLPVVDSEGHLLGVISRCDLLQLYNRPDDEILSEIRDQVMLRTLWMDPDTVHVTVTRGAVTLGGTVDRRSSIDLLALLVHTVPGVTEVVNHLTYHFDDRAGHALVTPVA